MAVDVNSAGQLVCFDLTISRIAAGICARSAADTELACSVVIASACPDFKPLKAALGSAVTWEVVNDGTAEVETAPNCAADTFVSEDAGISGT